MDQPQNTNPIVAQELISRLTEEIKNLRNENAQLQVRPSPIPAKGSLYNMTQTKLYRTDRVAFRERGKTQVTALRRITMTFSKK
ncbi:hypothetical protein BDM02DRAFT_3110836 [Thelephora ganbajun]|uniref:Uncharacterized protein n=1 Tax=Thelephora ganbajun TaxID=370292 RepID=A0ACB6ZQH3_THEGA|nr:hypothetical protein BDM02DRAFT_3110836 [Thelephora ganbajun]